ncbi:hypothetical protein K1719_020886 [Acacia pycnantha]|nr:hypothetical protein K1719_020886 [Acacia pycnantha]
MMKSIFYDYALALDNPLFAKLGHTSTHEVLSCDLTPDLDAHAVLAELAIPCAKPGPRVFQGCTVGFHPRSWELVSPNKGLELKLSRSAANGEPPTTLSPTVLIVDWRCKVARDVPYEVDISIPVVGYEPIQFVLTKMCEYKQNQGEGATRGWATFGVLSCIFFVSSTLFCCGGFIYKIRVENQRGIDALPGMTLLSAFLETVSQAGRGYSRPEEQNSAFANEASWERPPVSTQGASRPTERKYGSI